MEENMAEPIHQQVSIAAAPAEVYAALTEAARFAELSAAPASLDASPGGAFSLFNGMIEGRNIELASGRRIVQAWRVKNWPAGRYSLVTFDLEPDGQGTRLVFDQCGFPDADRAHLDGGWHKMYWEPLRNYLARKA
jgi:activator of HSP90 ATPase